MREHHARQVQRAFEALLVLENVPAQAVVEAHERLRLDPLGLPRWNLVGPSTQTSVIQQREGGTIYRIQYAAPPMRANNRTMRSAPYALFPQVEAPYADPQGGEDIR